MRTIIQGDHDCSWRFAYERSRVRAEALAAKVKQLEADAEARHATAEPASDKPGPKGSS